MADLRRKYVCRSDVALVKTTFRWCSFSFLFVPFPFSGGIGKRSSAGYDKKVPEYMEFLRNSSGKYNLVLPSLVSTFSTVCCEQRV